MAKPKPKQAHGVDAVQSSNTKAFVAIGAVILVIIALITAVLLATSKKSDDDSDSAMQYQPVTVLGAPLPADASDPQQSKAEAIGKPAPELEGKDFYGNAVNIKKNGKAKIVMIVSHTCHFCRDEVPKLAKWLGTDMSKYPNVEFLAISSSATPGSEAYPPSSWFKGAKYTLPVLVDDNKNSASTAYGLRAFPYFVVLDQNMVVLTRESGIQSQQQINEKLKLAQDSTAK